MRDRALVWEGCLNVRDLGGYATEDGRRTQFGRIVRADNVRRLSDAGWRELVAYGIGTIVDLRLHGELETDPAAELPVRVVHVPVVPEADSPHWVEIDALRTAGDDEVEATRLVYLEFLTRFASDFGRAVAAVANAPAGCVLVHCEGGKDRTGLVVALLLRLAGVPLDDVAEDYALSGENLRAGHDGWIADAVDPHQRLLRTRIAATPAEAMAAVLEHVERRHGGVREYLLAAGVSPEELDRAAARLRDEDVKPARSAE